MKVELNPVFDIHHDSNIDESLISASHYLYDKQNHLKYFQNGDISVVVKAVETMVKCDILIDLRVSKSVKQSFKIIAIWGIPKIKSG